MADVPRPTRGYTNTRVVETIETDSGSNLPYGGQSWGKYMPWYWLIWILLIPLFIYVVLQAFPPCWVLEQSASGLTAVNNVKLLGLSFFVGWLIVLIFWIICRFAL